ncbi:4-hydroxybenzoate octaprenyltransferase [Pontivivens ytuae]|uniref:4-hydroxybenzoate octaprenyltransferase n=1 Tax=Pontivivens ytuae TaxID=2789856 RepID=A0A7S9LP23_9RHOB|nr:4-hydroxybenzoate octaprenyltransferase [Pontivivens ytuae]QPH52451.1 4-hydroxybenzoate octaprenyltransferase [Pontivivens ytuae]
MTDPTLHTDGRVADATDANWVDRYAPAATRPYLRLSRADRPAGTWLLLLPCWWGLALAVATTGGWTPYTVWLAIACALGAFLMRGAGCTWNDLTDQDFDAQVARTRSRPLPSGQVTAGQARAWMIVQALAAFAILLTFPHAAILLGVLSLALVAVYPFAKRFTWWPQVFLGLAFNWGALLLWVAVTGSLSPAPIALYAAGIAWTLFYDTIYAHQDKEDDALIGVRSTARLFGERTPRWLLLFLVSTVTLAALAVILALISGPQVPLLVALAGVWGMGLHLNWQMRRLDIDDPLVCMHLFRSNRDAGLILSVMLALAAWLAAA